MPDYHHLWQTLSLWYPGIIVIGDLSINISWLVKHLHLRILSHSFGISTIFQMVSCDFAHLAHQRSAVLDNFL